MNSFVIVERGCRGEIEDVKFEKSELSLLDFCNKVFEERMGRIREVEKENMDYMDEFCGVSEIEEGIVEVCFGEEDSYNIFEIKM